MSEGDAPKSFIPNVVPKNSTREQARLQAQIGNMRQQNSQFIVNEVEKKYTLDKKGAVEAKGEAEAEKEEGEESKAVAGALDLASVPAVYFSACKKGEYVIDHRTSKILIENCEDCVIEVNGKILTACVEIWKCKNVHLKLNTKVKTLQADIMTGLKMVYATADHMQTIVWQDVDYIDVSFSDNSHPQLLTGHAHMQAAFPDSDMKIDQFIIRFVPELGPGLQPERCVRLKNGYLSTEREAADWDRRNEKARDLFVENFLKEGGIHLNKDKNATKKIPPNSICACGSKKKYKNCCSKKKAITGLHDTQTPKVFVQGKDGVKVETKEKDETSAMSALAITDSTSSTSSASSATPQTKAEKPAKSKSKATPVASSSPTEAAAPKQSGAQAASESTTTTSAPTQQTTTAKPAVKKEKATAKSVTSTPAALNAGTPQLTTEQSKPVAKAKKVVRKASEKKAEDAPKDQSAADKGKPKPSKEAQPVATSTLAAVDAPVMIHTEVAGAAAPSVEKKAAPKKKKVKKPATTAAPEAHE
jgi:hypothetical protein